MPIAILSVPGADCGACRALVLACLSAIPGVGSAEFDLPRHLASVDYDEAAVDVAALCQALSTAGYPAAHTAESPGDDDAGPGHA